MSACTAPISAYLAHRQQATDTKEGEVKPVARVDNEGHTLNGSNRYVLHFAPNQLPLVRGFWSLTAYTKDGALTGGKRVRFSLNDRDRLRKNRDGSIDVFVSADSPGRAHAANWLPAPDGDFQLTMRLYAPKTEASDGSWRPLRSFGSKPAHICSKCTDDAHLTNVCAVSRSILGPSPF